MLAPFAAPRPCPTWSGPVGFAETNSTWMRRPPPNAARVLCAPASRMRRTVAVNASVATLKLMKPGPAIATDAIEADSGSRATIRSATSRGLRLAMRARARATGLAKSPWASPRLRSTGISGNGPSASSPSSRSAASACSRSDRMCSFTDRILRDSRARCSNKMLVAPAHPPGYRIPDTGYPSARQCGARAAYSI